jgi:hypothetical protein
MIRITFALLLAFAASPALAYHLEVRSDSPLISEQGLEKMARAAGENVRHNIPDHKEVYVHVMTRAKPRDNDPTKYIYFHRAELRRHFTSQAPYVINGWLPIESTEFYGVDDKNGVERALENTLRVFFGEVKDLDPGLK